MRSAIIVAAGGSSRYGKNKLNEPLFDGTVLSSAVDVFRGIADEIIVVGAQVDGTIFVEGGANRHQSVANGLAAVSAQSTVVAVHDGARPFVSRTLVNKLFAEAEQHGSAVPCTKICDTLWFFGDNLPQKLDRNKVVGVQTPQVFATEKLRAAFLQTDGNYTDESTLFYDVYGNVHFVDGETTNKKITYGGDVPDYRIGVGFDVHAFGEGNGVVLGGVTIPFDKKLVGHSDADVLCHAICDAVLSACGQKDIGHQFPVDDDAYLGADSTVLLAKCVALAAERCYEVVNVSAVVVCERPKLAPHIDNMARILGGVLGVAPSCVNLTATTSEKLGALGNGDGIAAEANVLLKRFQ